MCRGGGDGDGQTATCNLNLKGRRMHTHKGDQRPDKGEEKKGVKEDGDDGAIEGGWGG